MKKNWSQEQIIGLLREAEAGHSSSTELCRLYGISQNTFYKWRTQYGGMNVDQAKKLKASSPPQERGGASRALSNQ